ncbi:hypothetical protein ACS0TY_005840 [Phlomoides rotata]
MAADKDQLQAVWFAAGTAAFMACIERAVVVSLFAHWRVWAFLALNLLLLAILYMTSKSQIESSTEIDEEDDCRPAFKEKQEELIPVVVAAAAESVESAACGGDAECEKKDVKQEGHEQISEEELNKRAEAFIAMFRQHLVSDAMNFRTRGNRFSRTAKVY